MSSTRRLVLLVAVAIFGVSAWTGGQTLSAADSLRATHETLMQAVAAANPDRVATLMHPRALGFFRMSQQVVELDSGGTLRVFVQTLLQDLGDFTAQQSLSTRIRVEGDAGIVTQTIVRETIVDKKKVPRHLRNTGVYVRSADGWRLLSWHTSDSPASK